MAHSPNAATKMRALLALGRIGDPRAIPWLLERFRDASPQVRARSLFAIGLIVDTTNLRHEGYEPRSEWLTPIVPLIADPDARVRLRAVEALGKSGDKRYSERVWSAILRAQENTEVMSYGITALVRLGDPAVMDRLAALRNHPSPEIRSRLAWAVYRLRNIGAAAQLKALLSDPSSAVRAQAALGFGLTGGDAVPSLVALLKDSSLRVRIAAARGLGLTGAVSAALPLVNFIRPHLATEPGEEEPALIAAAESWGSLKAAPGGEILLKLASEQRPAATAAIIALARSRKGDEAFSAGVELRAMPFWLQRARLAALGENGSRTALEKLLAFSSISNRESPLLLPWALDAVVQTARTIPPDAFWRHLSNPDPVLRTHAIQALTELNRRAPGRQNWTSEAVELILQSYFRYQSEPTPDAKLATIDFLATLEPAAALPRLERLARDGDRNVRLRARNMMQSRFGKAAPGEAGLLNTGRNDSFYENAIKTVGRYVGARFSTSRGDWTIRFFGSDAPLTVYNFVSLVQKGVLDNLAFPRVVPDFVLQGGDPRNDTEGGPGYSIRCEINEQPFLRGTVGMALSGKDSGGSQYFVAYAPQPILDGGYTAFAQVSDGMEIVDRMQLGDKVQKIALILRPAAASGSPSAEREPNSGTTSGRLR